MNLLKLIEKSTLKDNLRSNDEINFHNSHRYNHRLDKNIELNYFIYSQSNQKKNKDYNCLFYY